MTMQSAERASKRIGYLGHDVPIELIIAADALPAAIHGRVGEPTPHADRYLEPTFSPASRSIAEQWLEGELDGFESVVFSRSDDSAQRLYYYLCELQRRGVCAGPKPLMYDIAACDRASSRSHTLASTRHLARELGTVDSALNEAVERVKKRSDLLSHALAATRSQRAARGSFVQRRLRAASGDWTAQFDETLADSQDPMPIAHDSARLLMMGSTPGDEKLHEAAERAGANIVETLCASTPWAYESENAGGVLEQIALRYHSHPWRAMLQSPSQLCDRAESLQVSGVILWILAADTNLAWAYPLLERALRERGIRVLSLTIQTWDAPTSTLDAISSFAGERP